MRTQRQVNDGRTARLARGFVVGVLGVVGWVGVAAGPVQGAPMLHANLIVNGDAELGPAVPSTGTRVTPAGWADVAGQMWISPYGQGVGGVDHETPGPADRGQNFFWGGRVTNSVITQARDLGELAELIDSGAVAYSLSGWFGGWQSQNDRALLTAVFFDGDEAELTSATAGPVTNSDRANVTSLQFRETHGLVPAGTRAVVFTLTAIRVATTNNDGYADELAFVLMPDPSLLLGDMNLDGTVDTGDVAPFVLALTSPQAYQDQFGIDPALVGDINQDGSFDTGDVAPFVQLLVGGSTGGAAVPAPGSLALLGLAVLMLSWRRP